MSAYTLFKEAGVSGRLYRSFLEPMLLVTLFAPPTELSAAAALGARGRGLARRVCSRGGPLQPGQQPAPPNHPPARPSHQQSSPRGPQPTPPRLHPSTDPHKAPCTTSPWPTRTTGTFSGAGAAAHAQRRPGAV
jgi:hypothetical protein